MKMSKGLKFFSVILECSFIGCIILYIYNYFMASKKYEIMPMEVKKVLNIFVVVGIISFILFLIVKYILYIINRNVYEEDVQLQMDLSEPTEKKYKDLEAPVTERVFIYKNEYEVPKDRQAICPNCGSVIDKNAFLCVKCGFLLKEIAPRVIEKIVEKPVEKIVEKVVERPVHIISERIPRQGVVVRKNKKSRLAITNLIIDICLIAAAVTIFVLILYMAAQRGVIG